MENGCTTTNKRNRLSTERSFETQINRGYSLIYWNVQGLGSKLNIIEKVNKYDIIILAESFIEEKNCKNYEWNLPVTHNWHWSGAIRERVKGRARSGFLCGINKKIKGSMVRKDVNGQYVILEVEMKKKNHRIIAVYNMNGLKSFKKEYIND